MMSSLLERPSLSALGGGPQSGRPLAVTEKGYATDARLRAVFNVTNKITPIRQYSAAQMRCQSEIK
jgi:hypothetical protein